MSVSNRTTSCLAFSAFVLTLVAGCGGGGGGGGGGNANRELAWLVPTQDVADGGPGVDGIPSIDNPKFAPASTITDVGDNDLVIVMRSAGQVKAYPHDIMDWHEIVNDGPIDAPFTMSYCPLTASAIAWEGNLADADRSYGVSGLLYDSNLLLYDRATETLWSQMLQLAVNGPRIGDRPRQLRLFETSFSTLKVMYPDALVLTRDTGNVRNYDEYPYGDYQSSDEFLFRIRRQDNRMRPKERVLGIHTDDKSKVYQIGAFGASTQTINDQFANQSIVVVGNSALSYAAIYDRQLADGTILDFSPLQDDLPNVMTDSEGNVWDIFGTAVSGPRTGEQLEVTPSYIAMWFAWVAIFSDVEIYFN